MAADIAATAGSGGGARRGARAVRLSRGDRVALAIMVGIPTLVVGALIWFPTFASILLSFTNWDGIGGVGTAQWIGLRNYHEIATIYPPFWPAVKHNAIWLAFLTFVATPFGLRSAVDWHGPLQPVTLFGIGVVAGLVWAAWLLVLAFRPVEAAG